MYINFTDLFSVKGKIREEFINIEKSNEIANVFHIIGKTRQKI